MESGGFGTFNRYLNVKALQKTNASEIFNDNVIMWFEKIYIKILPYLVIAEIPGTGVSRLHEIDVLSKCSGRWERRAFGMTFIIEKANDEFKLAYFADKGAQTKLAADYNPNKVYGNEYRKEVNTYGFHYYELTTSPDKVRLVEATDPTCERVLSELVYEPNSNNVSVMGESFRLKDEPQMGE